MTLKEEVLDRNKPVYIDNNIHKTYIRIGSGDRKVTDDELKIMLFNAKIQTDDILLYEYTLDDLDEETISNFKDEVNTQYPEKNYNQLETEDFLKSIGALRKDRTNPSNGYKINLGALLFFGKYQSIKDFIPHYFLNYINLEGDSIRWKDRIASDEPNKKEMNIYNFYNIIHERPCNKLLIRKLDTEGLRD